MGKISQNENEVVEEEQQKCSKMTWNGSSTVSTTTENNTKNLFTYLFIYLFIHGLW